MTRNKDQKRRIRARMEKTGEAYTSARTAVLGPAQRHQTREGSSRSDWPALAGCSDDAVQKATGRTWADWVAALDAAEAHRMSHRDIVRRVDETDGAIGGWWCQSVAVGYERIRGLREVGQRRDGAFEASKSRTLPVDVSTLYAMFADARRRKKWLPQGPKRVRTALADKSIRLDWEDGTQVNLHFVPKGVAKSSVAVQHTKLAGKVAANRAKAFWQERLDALDDVLRSRASSR
jgi:hypothetical protein